MRTDTIFVLFGGGDIPFGKYFKPNFRHVFILTFDEFEWNRLEMINDRAYSRILSCEKGEFLPNRYLAEGFHCLEVEVRQIDGRRPNYCPLNFLNCVTFVKMFLGIRNFVQTPYGLYKNLIKINKTGNVKNGVISVTIR